MVLADRSRSGEKRPKIGICWSWPIVGQFAILHIYLLFLQVRRLCIVPVNRRLTLQAVARISKFAPPPTNDRYFDGRHHSTRALH